MVSAALCVPSMHLIQKGFKSPVYRMNILTMKRTTRSQLRKGDRPWEGRLWENHQAMYKKSIRGRQGGMSWHNTAKFLHLALPVNGTLGWWRIRGLPGEISTARGCESGSAVRSNALGDGREVSRGHSTGSVNRGAGKCPFKHRNPQARSGKDQTGSTVRPVASSKVMNPTGGAGCGDGAVGRERETVRGHCSERRGDHRSLPIRG